MSAASFAIWWEVWRLRAQSLTPALLAREAYLAGIAEGKREQSRRLEDHIVIDRDSADFAAEANHA